MARLVRGQLAVLVDQTVSVRISNQREALTMRISDVHHVLLDEVVERTSELVGVDLRRSRVAAKLLEDAIRRRAEELGVAEEDGRR